MKRLLISTFLLLLFLPLTAAPKWLKTVNKSLVRVYALQPQGDTIQANGFFTNERGTLVAPFKSIRQATSAWIVDAADKRYEVSRIVGFNATYNVVRLQAETGKKKSTYQPPTPDGLTQGKHVVLMPEVVNDDIVQVERAGNYNYYTLASAATPERAGLPVLDEAGQVAGILQTPVLSGKAPNYALDIRLVESLDIKPMDANNPDLRSCAIPKRLPDDENQALSFIYLSNTPGNKLYEVYVNDFIQAHPGNATGYVLKAEHQAETGHYDASAQTYEEGLKQTSASNDELLYSRSRTLYNCILQNRPNLPKAWTLDQALADVQAAQAANPLPLYVLHEGRILYAQKQYEQALQRYLAVTQTKMRSAEVFLYAWQCKQNLKAPLEELLALNDSAVACFSQPYNVEAAPFLLLRSNTLTEMGRLREAIADLNDYEHLMQGRLTAQFYYQREQLEARTHMFAQAVNDIHKAISLDKREPVFHAELAVLLYRLNDVDNALVECRKAIELDANYPDAHRLLGVCLREQGDKAGAREALAKAAELGDKMAQEMLKDEE